MLSNQALNVGRSFLGIIDLIWGLGRVSYKNHYDLHHPSSNIEKFTFDSVVQGYHVCKDVWKPTIGENLHAEQELDNTVDKFAVKVVKNNKQSAIYLTNTRKFFGI